MKYSKEELEYLATEIERLENARNEKYDEAVRLEWKRSFQEEGYTADQACRMVRKVRLANNIFKVKFSDFIAMDIQDMPNIIPVKNLLPVGDSEKIAKEKEESILRTQQLVANVRNILDLSFFDFIAEARDRGSKMNTRKFTITVSDCCGAEVSLTGCITYGAVCNKCGKECKTKPLSCTPDEDIVEVLNDKINEIKKHGRGKHGLNTLILKEAIILLNSIAEQLNININD